MKGKLVVGLCNLPPRAMRGVTSAGMLLCASNEDHTRQAQTLSTDEFLPRTSAESATLRCFSRLFATPPPSLPSLSVKKALVVRDFFLFCFICKLDRTKFSRFLVLNQRRSNLSAIAASFRTAWPRTWSTPCPLPKKLPSETPYLSGSTVRAFAPRKRRGSSAVCRDGGNEDKSTRWRCQLGGSGDGDVVRRRMHFLCIGSRAMTRAVVGKAAHNRPRHVPQVSLLVTCFDSKGRPHHPARNHQELYTGRFSTWCGCLYHTCGAPRLGVGTFNVGFLRYPQQSDVSRPFTLAFRRRLFTR